MNKQPPGEMQLLLKHYFSIQHPQRNCPNGNQIANICINPNCEANAIYCEQKGCTHCKTHIICERVYLHSLTHLLQKRVEGQRQFISKVLEIENSMLQQIQKRRKAFVDRLFLGDLQSKHFKVIEGLYLKKQQNLQVRGEVAEQTYRILKRTVKQASEPDRQLLQTFKTELQRIIKILAQAQNKLVQQFYKKSRLKGDCNTLEGSTIITKQNVDYLKFLNQSFPSAKRFKLLFKASQHGFQAAKFHQKCDNIRHTFTLIKTEFGKIIGGYTPLKWNQAHLNAYVGDPQNLSFLLSFNLGQKMRLIQPTKAIFNCPSYGPTFGSGYDIYISNKCNQNNSSYANLAKSYNCNGMYAQNQYTYTAFGGPLDGWNFKVAEYEVYEVLW